MIGATGASAEEIAKCLLMQAALAKKGVSPDKMAKALSRFIEDKQKTLSHVSNNLAESGLSQEDVAKAVTLSKALEAGKVRGLKSLNNIVENGTFAGEEDVLATLKAAAASNNLSPDGVAAAVAVQKSMGALHVDAQSLAKTMALQRALLGEGVPSHEVCNAMAMAMALGTRADDCRKEIEAALAGLSLSPEDVRGVLALAELAASGAAGATVAPEAVRLIRKAMKQRRGSVENIAETLMATLAAGGESSEGIARAMIRALKATGASAEEIARTMAQAMERNGASKEDVARILAGAVIEADMSGNVPWQYVKDKSKHIDKTIPS